MTGNPYYSPSGTPATSSAGASAPMRTEFGAVQTGFSKLPDYTALAAGAFLKINSANTAIDVSSVLIESSGKIGIGNVSPAFKVDILDSSANASTTLNVANANTGNAAAATLRITNGTTITAFAMTGLNYVATNTYDIQDGLYAVNTGAGGVNFALISASASFKIFTGGTSPAERFRVNPSGLVGIGNNNPINILDVVQSQNSTSVLSLLNANSGNSAISQIISKITSAGTGASAQLRCDNGTNALAFLMNGTGVTPANMIRADGGFINCSGAGGLTFNTNAVQPIYFGINNVEKMRLDTSGNLKLGTGEYEVTDIAGGASMGALAAFHLDSNNGGLILKTLTAASLTEAMRIDATGQVGIGMTPANFVDIGKNQGGTTKAVVNNTNTGGASALQCKADTSQIYIATDGSTIGGTAYAGLSGNSLSVLEAVSSSAFYIGTLTAAPIVFAQNRVEMMRLTNTGQLLIGATSPLGSEKCLISQATANVGTLIALNTAASPSGATIFNATFNAAAPNNTSATILLGSDNVAVRFQVYSNGGIANYSANNVNLSDARVKSAFTRYAEADLAALESSFTAVDWGRFKYRDQTHDEWNHGYTAQGVARAFANTAPELVGNVALGPKNLANVMGVYEHNLTNISHALLARALTRIADLETRLGSLH
jgi:hypothetical protein